MKTSVLIPAYNCSKTIEATLDSVLGQSVVPDEVIVLDDGSTDDTFSILQRYQSRITAIRQPNGGVAKARNILCKRAIGDLLAFLDSDDQWHPKYLETQCKTFEMYPEAAGCFTGHVNFKGTDSYDWAAAPVDATAAPYLIQPLVFLKEYNRNTGMFASMSYFCLPRNVVASLGDEPFHEQLSGVEDSFLCTTLPLLGRPVAYVPTPLAAYRFTDNSLSTNRVKAFAAWVNVFRFLEDRYRTVSEPGLRAAFKAAYASKRRAYAKILMGAGNRTQARQQLWQSVTNSLQPGSILKSLLLLCSTYAPRVLQPEWPSATRR